MRPSEPDPSPDVDLFRNRLDNLLDQRHELYRLSDLIDWQSFDAAFGELYCPDNGCPAKATRLMVGLQYLKHLYSVSDDAAVMRWVENPYWQYFCGEEYFQHELPIDPSSMSRFRQRIGEAGCEKILQATVKAGLHSRTIKPAEPKRVSVDTTVQEKAVTFPTDSKLLNRSRERLVKLCRSQPAVDPEAAQGFLSLAFGAYSWRPHIGTVSNAHRGTIKPIFTVGNP